MKPIQKIREIVGVNNWRNFLAFLLAVMVTKILTSNNFIFSLLFGIQFEYNGRIDFGWIKLDHADLLYPIFIVVVANLIARIKQINLFFFVLLYFIIDFSHILILLKFSNNHWKFAIAFQNAFTMSFTFFMIGIFARNKYSTIVSFGLGYFLGDLLGYWIPFYINYPQFIKEFMPLKEYVNLLKLYTVRFIEGLLFGSLYVMLSKKKSPHYR